MNQEFVTLSREVVEQALEAMESGVTGTDYDRKAQALHAALEQPQVEQERCHLCDCTGDINGLDGEWRGECPYCRPQPPRQPLTRERIKAIQHELSDTVGCSYETMARAIEAAHNIK